MTNEMTLNTVADIASTNAIIHAGGPGNENMKSDGHAGIWTGLAVAVAVVTVVAWAAKKLKANSAEFEKKTEDRLLDDILDAVAKDASDRAALREELAAAMTGGASLRTAPLATILRIEESYEKQSSGRYLRRVSILRRKEGTTGALTKVERELGWEYIPEAIREQFIKTRESKVVRLVYDGGKGT